VWDLWDTPTWVTRRILTVRGWRTSGTAPDDHFRSADTTVENAWKQSAMRITLGIHRKTAFDPLGTAQKRHLHLWAAKLVNGRKRLDQHHPTQLCGLWDTPTGLLDGFRLFGAGSVDSDRIPSWRHQNGSGVPERFPMWWAWFFDGLRLVEEKKWQVISLS